MTQGDVPIAVIGMALRAPGAETPEEFWDNILGGRDTLTRPTETQLRRLGVPDRLIRNPSFVRARPLLKDPGGFDSAFFDVSAVSARMIDPCHRLFMACAWEAMERAGVVPGAEAGVVGVFGGGGGGQTGYAFRNFGGGSVDLDDPDVWLPINVCTNLEHLTSRVCFHLDLRGPNVTAQAACATSLLAIHLAVSALRHGDCEVALAGGASVDTPHWPGYVSVEGGPLSPSGTVRPFDEAADGTVFGSGVGVVVLKRLDEALDQGDHVHSLILGTGICNDGGQKNNLAAPALDGQITAIMKALDNARVGAETIGLLEAHGTGTFVGDPIEVEATSRVYRRDTAQKQYCPLGAVKANIGHTKAAAGVLGVIKTCMALERGIIPPNIHFERPNPRLDLPATPFYIPTKSARWSDNGHPRRAGVSAFGFGGNNAHVVLEAPPPPLARTSPHGPAIVVLSARTPAALDRQIDRLADHLNTHPEVHLEDVAHTLQVGRKPFDHRAAVVASRTAEASSSLSSHSVHRGQAGEERRVIFAFSGQGSQRAGMGHALYQDDPSYRADVDRCAELLVPHLNLDIRSLLHDEGDNAAKQIVQTAFSQPALFVVEYALARRLMACSVEPTALIGHSIGELVAACLAGVFSLPDSLALVSLRGRLMQACAPGSMMAVFLPAGKVQPRLEAEVEIAALNAPDLTVVSGPDEAISRMESRLEAEGLGHKVLQTSHGFHSRSMEPAVNPFREAVSRVERSAPSLPFISNVMGRLITAEEATDPDYWANHIRQPVRFAPGVEALGEIPAAVWVEVGPGGTLSSLIRRQTDGVPVVSTLDGDRQDRAGLLDVLSRLWVEGVPLKWCGLGAGSGKRKVTLPTYPFEIKNYWIDPPVFQPERGTDQVPLKVEPLQEEEEWLHVPAWREQPLRTPVLSEDEGWLIFEDGVGLGTQLRARLQQAGARVFSLQPGARFERSGPDTFRVRPGVADDLVAVLQAGAASGWTPQRILHLWEVDGRPGRTADQCQTLGARLGSGFHTLTALVQALFEQGVEEEVQLTVAADGVAALDGEDGQVYWEKASLLGPCRVAPREMPSLSCQLIDVPAAELSASWLAEGLLAEASAPEVGTLKALRKGGRYIEVFRPLPNPIGPSGLRAGAVVLITGGVGGLGLEVAGRLFEMAGSRLVLLTRWLPPPVEDWPERAKTDDRIGQALRKVLALTSRGAEVLVLRGDAAVAGDMVQVVDQVRAHFGSIDGVVHAAGVAASALILESVHERLDDALAPKVKGALILEELLGGDPLDFFISFSSVASVAPTAGQVDYAAANAVLDALAKRRVGSSWSRVCSISWDGWQEVGMAVEAARRKSLEARLSRDHSGHSPCELTEEEVFNQRYARSIPLQLGLDIFQELLQAAELPPHVIVSLRPLGELDGDGAPALQDEGTSEVKRASMVAYRSPSNPAEEQIVEIWEQVLSVDSIGMDDDFLELGGDSISSMQILNRLRKVLGSSPGPRRTAAISYSGSSGRGGSATAQGQQLSRTFTNAARTARATGRLPALQ